MTDIKTTKHLRRTTRATYNHLRKATDKLQLLLAIDPDDLQGTTIGDMRDEVEAITQRFHEFSAFWNVYNTHLETNHD